MQIIDYIKHARSPLLLGKMVELIKPMLSLCFLHHPDTVGVEINSKNFLKLPAEETGGTALTICTACREIVLLEDELCRCIPRARIYVSRTYHYLSPDQ